MLYRYDATLVTDVRMREVMDLGSRRLCPFFGVVVAVVVVSVDVAVIVRIVVVVVVIGVVIVAVLVNSF